MTPTTEPKVKTTYFVLKQIGTVYDENEDGDAAKSKSALAWIVVGSAEADNADQAIKAVLSTSESVGDGSGTFVAVSGRTWKPVTVAVETKRVVSLG